MEGTIRVPTRNVTFATAERLAELGLTPLPATAEAPVEMHQIHGPYGVGMGLGRRLADALDFADLDAVAEALQEDRPSLAAGLVMGLRQALDAAVADVLPIPMTAGRGA